MIFGWRDAPAADFAVIGDPIHHSKSPKMHMAAYESLGLDYHYIAVHIPVGEIEPAISRLRDLGYRGINVTLPHKEAAYGWATQHDVISQRLGVCNTLNLLTGEGRNTDVPGFAKSLEGIAFSQGKALVLGAGGSARAILCALEDSGWELTLWNRTHERALRVVKEIAVECVVVEQISLDGVGLVINTTSASLSDQELPIESLWKTANRDLFLVDISYGAEPTRLMKSAQAAGFRTMDGKRMLMEQGALALEFWLGQAAPRDVMLEALES
jgi:shikimate dehydrogenase